MKIDREEIYGDTSRIVVVKWMAWRMVKECGALTNAATGILVLLVISEGCKRQGGHSTDHAGVVVFENAGITLKPGEGWKENRDTEPAASALGEICPPRLEGQGGFVGSAIQVFVMNGHLSPQKNVDHLRKQISTEPAVIPSSFKEESVSTETGLRAMHVEYNQKAEEKDRKWLVRTHFYLLKNAKGRCVGILYVTPAGKDSAAVHQMIRETLALR